METVLDNLDMELILSVRADAPELSGSSNVNISSPVYPSFDSGIPEFNFFHEISKDDDRNLILSLKNMNAIEINNILRVKNSTESYRKMMEFVSKIVRLPSAILISVWLSNGRFYVNILFNHSISSEMSEILMENFPQNQDIYLEYLGESGGFNTILSQINSRSQIMIAQLELHPPDEELSYPRNPIGDSWVRILKFPMIEDDLNCVYFVENGSVPEIDSHKVNDNLFEAQTKNTFIKAMEAKFNECRIPIEVRVNILQDGKFTYILAFPDIFRNEIVSILGEMFHEKGQWKPTLVRLEKYGDWVQGIF